eukprot:191165-Chlamydomonas_euryale.AAC.2
MHVLAASRGPAASGTQTSHPCRNAARTPHLTPVRSQKPCADTTWLKSTAQGLLLHTLGPRACCCTCLGQALACMCICPTRLEALGSLGLPYPATPAGCGDSASSHISMPYQPSFHPSTRCRSLCALAAAQPAGHACMHA